MGAMATIPSLFSHGATECQNLPRVVAPNAGRVASFGITDIKCGLPASLQKPSILGLSYQPNQSI